MAETVTEFLRGHGVPPELAVFIISLLPILELRGGLVAASLMDVPWLKAVLISVVGNIIPVPFIIIFIEKILGFLKNHGPIKKFASWIENKGRTGGEKLQKQYPNQLKLGLFLFVGVPLPGTGAWTGSLIAALLGLKPKDSAPAIGFGVVLAAAIMSVVAYVIPGMMGLKG